MHAQVADVSVHERTGSLREEHLAAVADGGALTLKSSIYVPMWSSFGRSDLTLRLRLEWTIPEEAVRVVLEDMHVLWGLRQGSGMSPGWRGLPG